MKNNKVFFWSLVVALGGFLFGFDTAVISGAEKAIQQLWGLSAVEHGFTIAIALIGTVFGAIFGGVPSDKLGRRQTLIWIAVLYFVSALGAALTSNWVLFMIFRFLGGLGVGASSVTAPLYISEVSPRESRGRMVSMFQFNIVFGILAAYLSNYLLTGTGEQDWRWMLGVQVVPALAFFLLLFRVPESPRWLHRAGAGRGGAAGAAPHQPRHRRPGRDLHPDHQRHRRGGRGQLPVCAPVPHARACWPCSSPSSTRCRASTPSSTSPRASSK